MELPFPEIGKTAGKTGLGGGQGGDQELGFGHAVRDVC